MVGIAVIAKPPDHRHFLAGCDGFETELLVKQNLESGTVELKEMPGHLMFTPAEVGADAGHTAYAENPRNFFAHNPRHSQMFKHGSRIDHVKTIRRKVVA